MAFTKQNFVYEKKAVLTGATVGAVGAVNPFDPVTVPVLDGSVTPIDTQSFNLATAGYAKNAAFSLTLAISTPATVSLATISTVVTGTVGTSAGDNTFATINLIEFVNTGAQDIIVGAAASTPFLGPMLGTTPTTTVPAGSRVVWESVAGWPITTNVNLKFDPSTVAATMVVAIGGA